MIDKIILYIQIAATLYLVIFLLFCGYVVSEMIEFFYLIKSMDLKYQTTYNSLIPSINCLIIGLSVVLKKSGFASAKTLPSYNMII